tara:strand:- start:1922 stop:3031 length:1110 start_codon:yes stop_codon:yes gene_type:complete
MKKIKYYLKTIISYSPFLYNFIKKNYLDFNNKIFFIPLNTKDFQSDIINKKYYNFTEKKFNQFNSKYNYFLIFRKKTIMKYSSKKLEKLFNLIQNQNADVAYDGDCPFHTEIASKEFIENYSKKLTLTDYPYKFFYFKKNFTVKNIGSEHRSYNFNGTFRLPSGGETIGDQGEVNFRLNFIPDLTNKTFLDIGSEEGYAVFEALKKNAKIAKGINILESKEYDFFPDYLRPKEITPRNRKELEKTQKFLINEFKVNDPDKIKFDYKNVYNLDESFDCVFCFGVLYHLKDPYKALENLFNVTNETLFIETQGIKNGKHLISKIDEGDGFVRHSSNALKFLLYKVGFKNVEILVETHHTGSIGSIVLRADK